MLRLGTPKPHRKALLDTIAGTESAGDYNVIYGGKRVSDLSRHPRQFMPIMSGPNKGKKSSAAGRYQFLGSTWDQYANKLGLKDFSPASQDAAAWALASDAYRTKTGGDLDAVLASGDPRAIAQVGKALSGTWTSLPGGIEAGTNADRFVSAYQKAAGQPPRAVQPSAVPTQALGPEPVSAPSQAPASPSQELAPPVAEPDVDYKSMLANALMKGTEEMYRPAQQPLQTSFMVQAAQPTTLNPTPEGVDPRIALIMRALQSAQG